MDIEIRVKQGTGNDGEIFVVGVENGKTGEVLAVFPCRDDIQSGVVAQQAGKLIRRLTGAEPIFVK